MTAVITTMLVLLGFAVGAALGWLPAPRWLRRNPARGWFVVALLIAATVLTTVADKLRTERPDPSAVVTSLAADLERVKVLLPPDDIIADCLQARSEQPFMRAYQACDSATKRDDENAVALLDRNLPRLRLVLTDDELGQLMTEFGRVRFAAYEMQNNALVSAHWHHEGCPRDIKLVPATSADQVPQRPDGHVRCALAVSSYKNFLEHQQPHAPLDAAVTSTRSIEDFEMFILPGDTQSLESHFHDMNTMLYTAMLTDIEDLLVQLREVLGLPSLPT